MSENVRRVPIGRQLLQILILLYRANRPVLLVGDTGVGKSEIIAACARELGIAYIVRDLSLLEPTDLLGLPITAKGVTTYAPPIWLPTTERGLLVFEELNRAPRHTLAPCLQLLSARMLNDYRLPEGWLPIAAINPPEDGRYLVEELDAALQARFVVVQVRPDVNEWAAWATAHGVHADVVAYVVSTPKIFDAPQSNPRAWTYVSQVLQQYERNEVNDLDILMPCISGLVGDELTRAFLRFYANSAKEKPLSAQVILKNYKSVGKLVRGWRDGGNTAQQEATIHQVLLYLQDPNNEAGVRGSPSALGNLQAFAADLIPDLRLKFERALKKLLGRKAA